MDFLDSTEGSVDLGESSSLGSVALLGVASAGYVGTSVSEGAGTEGVGSLSTTAEGASMATNNPGQATAGTVVASTFGGITTASWGDDFDGLLILFRKDKTPYTAVEQKARYIYDVAHGKKTEMKRSCIIAERSELVEAAGPLLSASASRVEETLESLERGLEEYLAER